MRKLVFKILAFVIALVAFAMGLQDWRAISRVKSMGQMAVVESAMDISRLKSRKFASYAATFSFRTDSGAVIRQRRPAPQTVIDAIRNGTEVKVYYDPANPSQFVFESERTPWQYWGIGGAFLVIGLLFL